MEFVSFDNLAAAPSTLKMTPKRRKYGGGRRKSFVCSLSHSCGVIFKVHGSSRCHFHPFLNNKKVPIMPQSTSGHGHNNAAPHVVAHAHALAVQAQGAAAVHGHGHPPAPMTSTQGQQFQRLKVLHVCVCVCANAMTCCTENNSSVHIIVQGKSVKTLRGRDLCLQRLFS